MSSSKPRSGIPVTGGKSSIPVVRKTTGQSTPSSATRNGPNRTRSGIPSPSSSADKLPGVRKKPDNPSNQGTKKRGGEAEAADDSKALKVQVEKLCREILDKDIALQELTEKFAQKSEECTDLLEEQNALRRRNSVDLQHVTKDYDELQEKLKHQQTYITDMETNHAEDKERLTLELEILKGEHEMEISMLKKEMQDMKAKAERKKSSLEVDDDAASDTSSRGVYPGMEAMQEQMSSLQANYEEEIQTVKEQLQQQMEKTNDAVERYEQQEFEFHENLNKLKNAFNQEQELIVERHQSEIADLRSSYEERLKLQEQRHQSSSGFNGPTHVHSDVEALKEEHEAYIEALKEQYDADLQQLKTDLKEKDEEIMLIKKQMADDILLMQNEYETKICELQSELEKSADASSELAIKDATIQELKLELDNYTSEALDAVSKESLIDELKEQHKKELEEIRSLQRKEIEDLKIADKGRESGDESAASKSSLESELQQKEQLQAYEHEIRNLKSELKKERHEFGARKDSLESSITDLEGRMKEREEQVRSELDEEHQYVVETLEEEHNDAMHEKEKSHRQEITKLKQEYTEKLAVAEALIKTEGDMKSKIQEALKKQKEEYAKEIEDLKHEHESEMDQLHETLENLQMENEELHTEFDLVVNDLNSELESTKIKARGEKRRGSGVLKEQIEKLKGNNEEHVAHLVEELERYKAKVVELEKEAKELRSEEKPNEIAADYLGKISELERLVETLEAERGDSEELAEYKAECEMLQDEVQQYKRLGDEDRRRVEEYKEMAGKLQEQLDKVAQDKLKEAEDHGKKMSELVGQLRNIKEEQEKEREELRTKNDQLKSELEGMQKEKQEFESQRLDFQKKITELQGEMDTIVAENNRREKENQKLHTDTEEAWNRQRVESDVVASESFVISEENTDMIGEEILPDGRKEDRQYDQRMKALVDELESKVSDLDGKLEQANLKIASKDRRLESLNSEMNVLRENLEDERAMVQNLEQRIQGLVYNHEAEVKLLRQKSEEKEDHRKSEVTSEEEYLKTISQLRQDLESSLTANEKQAEKIENLDGKVLFVEQQLVREQESLAEHMSKNHELEKRNANLEDMLAYKEEELKAFEEQQIEHEASSLAEDLKKSTEFEDKIRNLEKQLSLKNEELVKSEQQLIALEANSLAEKLKAKEKSELKFENLERDLAWKKEEAQTLMSSLETERTRHAQKAAEFDYMVEQIKNDAAEGERIQDLVNEVQKHKEQIASLNSTFEDERARSLEKVNQFEKEAQKTEYEIKSLTEMVEKERGGHLEMKKKLEGELERRRDEVKELSSMLETEQSSHEKTIKDTQKHFARIDQVEQENVALKGQCGQLKAKLRGLREELSRQKEQNSELLSRSQKMTMEEMEEVHKLNRSLGEAEIDKGKLLGEVESTKQEVKRAQDKYNKIKEKYNTAKQKWMDDHEKLEGMLTSPRKDMGLQTAIIDQKDIDDVNQRLSLAVRENAKLEIELKDSKDEAQRKRNDMLALRRANDVLIKQNQTLYLETENLKMKIGELSAKSNELREVSLHLTKENERFGLENKDLKDQLNTTRQDLHRIEGERSSVDALNQSSRSELEELTNIYNKHKDENERLKEQNDFLLTQGKRLQSRADELESQVKELKTNVFLKDLSFQQSKETPIRESIVKSNSEIALQESAPQIDLQRFAEENKVMQQNLERMQGLLSSKEVELQKSQSEKLALIDGFTREKSELTSQLQTLKSPSSSPNGEKGYVGIKSYQVIEWDRQAPATDPPSHVTTAPVPRDPLEGLQVAKAKELDFDSSSYLGSAYWEAMSFLNNTSSEP